MKTAFKIKWVEETDSTNNELLRHLDELDNLSVLSAVRQTAGRGQRGNRWEAAPGENLTFSMLLRPGKNGVPPIAAKEQFFLSELSTLAICDTLKDAGLRPAVKWPNDVWLGGKKVCGMLIENSLSGTDVSASVIGIGLNVNQLRFDPSLTNPTSMAAASGRHFDVRAVLENFVACFERRLFSDASREEIRREYLSMMLRLGQSARYRDCVTLEEFDGVIEGVSREGRLIVRLPDGSVKDFAFKEISYIV